MGEDSFFSGFQELDTPPITLRSHGEMYPVAPVPVALDKQFIEVLLPVISRIEQYCCITDGLLNACNSHGEVMGTGIWVYPAPVPLILGFATILLTFERVCCNKWEEMRQIGQTRSRIVQARVDHDSQN